MNNQWSLMVAFLKDGPLQVYVEWSEPDVKGSTEYKSGQFHSSFRRVV